MTSNNRINSPTNPLGWIAFTTSITATTTAPTFGTGTQIKSYYLQQGKLLSVRFLLIGTATGSNIGSGTYLFSIPSGFSMNTSIVSFNNTAFSLGSAFAFLSAFSTYGSGSAVAYDSTHYAAFLFLSSSGGNYLSSGWFQATASPTYSMSLQIPIV